MPPLKPSNLQPTWATLSNSQSASVTASEDELNDSSQDMRDELEESPVPRPPPPQKRKSAVEETARESPPKRSRCETLSSGRTMADLDSDEELPRPRRFVEAERRQSRDVAHRTPGSQAGASNTPSNKQTPTRAPPSNTQWAARAAPATIPQRHQNGRDSREDTPPRVINVARKTTNPSAGPLRSTGPRFDPSSDNSGSKQPPATAPPARHRPQNNPGPSTQPVRKAPASPVSSLKPYSSDSSSSSSPPSIKAVITQNDESRRSQGKPGSSQVSVTQWRGRHRRSESSTNMPKISTKRNPPVIDLVTPSPPSSPRQRVARKQTSPRKTAAQAPEDVIVISSDTEDERPPVRRRSSSASKGKRKSIRPTQFGKHKSAPESSGRETMGHAGSSGRQTADRAASTASVPTPHSPRKPTFEVRAVVASPVPQAEARHVSDSEPEVVGEEDLDSENQLQIAAAPVEQSAFQAEADKKAQQEEEEEEELMQIDQIPGEDDNSFDILRGSPNQVDSPTVEGIVPALDDMALKSGSATPGSSVGLQDLETPRKAHDTVRRTDGSKPAPVSAAPSLAWSNRDGSGILSRGPPSSVSSSVSSPQLRPSTAGSAFSTLSLPEHRKDRPPFTRTASSAPSPAAVPPAVATPKSVGQSQRPPKPPGSVRALYGGPDGFFGPLAHRRQSSSQHAEAPAARLPRSTTRADRSARASMSESPTRGYASSGSPNPFARATNPSTTSTSRSAQSPNPFDGSAAAAHDFHQQIKSSGSPVRSTASDVKSEGAPILNSSPRRYSRRGYHDEAALTQAILNAKFEYALQKGEINDLTMDSDEENEASHSLSPHASDEEAARISTNLLAARGLLPDSPEGSTHSSPTLKIATDLPSAAPAELGHVQDSGAGNESADEEGSFVDGEAPMEVDDDPSMDVDQEEILHPVDTERFTHESVGESVSEESQDASFVESMLEMTDLSVPDERPETPETPDLVSDDASSSASLRPRRNPRRSTRVNSASTSTSSLLEFRDATAAQQPRVVAPRQNSGVSEALVPAMEDVDIEDDVESVKILDWAVHGKSIAKEYASEFMLAEDVPHKLQDTMNSLSDTAKRGNNMAVTVFESMISENTPEEPGAPPISVINDVDEELTPPFEFHYSNLIWHGKNVPPPDLGPLQSCQCEGPCDPHTCSCTARLRKMYQTIIRDHNEVLDPNEERIDDSEAPPVPPYDKYGRLKPQVHGWPIVECNALCKCTDDCKNRVVQLGRKVKINIVKTDGKGWGIFAGERIHANTYIGIYAGEILTNEEGNRRGRIYDLAGKTYLFDIDFWHINEKGKKRTGDSTPKFCVDAYHVGNFTRYMNHSCAPNCRISPCWINESDPEKPLMTIFTIQDVAAGQELCFSYRGDNDDNVEKKVNGERTDPVYVNCQCGAPNCQGTLWL